MDLRNPGGCPSIPMGFPEKCFHGISSSRTFPSCLKRASPPPPVCSWLLPRRIPRQPLPSHSHVRAGTTHMVGGWTWGSLCLRPLQLQVPLRCSPCDRASLCLWAQAFHVHFFGQWESKINGLCFIWIVLFRSGKFACLKFGYPVWGHLRQPRIAD